MARTFDLRFPLGSIASAVMVGVMLQFVLFDWGLPDKKVLLFHRHVAAAGPLVTVGGEGLDVLECAAAAAAAVCGTMALLRRSSDDVTAGFVALSTAYARRARLGPVLAGLREGGSGGSYVGAEKYQSNDAESIRTWDGIVAGACLVGTLMAVHAEAAEPRGKGTVARWRLPGVALGTAVLLGVLAVDLLFDLHADDWRACTQYYAQYSRDGQLQFPCSLGVLAVAALTAVPLLLDARRTRGAADLACVALGVAQLVILVGPLEAAKAELVHIKDRVPSKGPKRERFALGQLAEVRRWHVVLAGLMLAVVLLKLWSGRFTRPVRAAGKKAAPKKKAEKQATDEEQTERQRQKEKERLARKADSELQARRLAKAEKKAEKLRARKPNKGRFGGEGLESFDIERIRGANAEI